MAVCNVHNSPKNSWCERKGAMLAGAGGYQKFLSIIGSEGATHTGFRSAHLSFVCFFFQHGFVSQRLYLAVEDGGLFFHERDALGVCPE